MPELIINHISDTGQAAVMIRELSERGFSVVANSTGGKWSITARHLKEDSLSAIQQLVRANYPIPGETQP
jgi:hypothetical protein